MLSRVSSNNEKKAREAVPDSKQSGKKATWSPRIEKCRCRGVGSVLLSPRGVDGRTNTTSS